MRPGHQNQFSKRLNFVHAERIGHGYAIIEDPDVYYMIQDKDVHLECCLTSSIQTNAIGKYIPEG